MNGVNAVSVVSQVKASPLALRLFSVAVFLPLILLVVYWGVFSVALLVSLTAILCLIELYRALKHTGYHPRFGIGIASVLMFCAHATIADMLPFDATGLLLTLVLLTTLLLEVFRRNHENSLEAWTLTFAGACYVGWLLSYYILLSKLATPLTQGWLALLHLSPGAAWIYFVLAVTWLQDAFAYFVGRSIGKHKMAPYISPKKSWEGAIGGLVAAAAAAALALPILGLPISYSAALLMGFIGGVAGLVGDLVESLIKRQIGMKDMSHLMPGHGGLLDRADSMLFTAPVLYYLILLFTH